MWIQLLIILFINFIDFVVAISLNTSIVVINVKGMKSGKKLSPSDLIHVIMGLVNITMRCLLISQSIGIWISPWYVMNVFYMMVVLLPFQMYFTYWLTAWLCVYYCTTITNFSHRLFVWVKRSLSTFLPYVLLLSGVGSFVISVPSIWIVNLKTQAQYPGNSTLSPTIFTGIASFSLPYTILVSVLGCFLPFIIIVISLMVTVFSLVRHVWKIKQNDSGFACPKLQTHINAIRTIILLFIVSAIFYIAETMAFKGASDFNDTVASISWYIITFFPAAEAIIIIQASSKLRKRFQGFSVLKNWWILRIRSWMKGISCCY